MARGRAKPKTRRHKKRRVEPRFVIATEGRSTEMKYFDKLRERYGKKNVKFAPRKWNRTSPMQVLNDLIDFRSSQSRDRQRTDEYWIVIDLDKCNEQELSQVQNRARLNNCSIADSNPCFELWLLLHFKPMNEYKRLRAGGDNSPCSPLERNLERVDRSYDREKKGQYDAAKYMDNILEAIRNASTTEKYEEGATLDRFGTRVYRLVDSIRKSPGNTNNPLN